VEWFLREGRSCWAAELCVCRSEASLAVSAAGKHRTPGHGSFKQGDVFPRGLNAFP